MFLRQTGNIYNFESAQRPNGLTATTTKESAGTCCTHGVVCACAWKKKKKKVQFGEYKRVLGTCTVCVCAAAYVCSAYLRVRPRNGNVATYRRGIVGGGRGRRPGGGSHEGTTTSVAVVGRWRWCTTRRPGGAAAAAAATHVLREDLPPR